MTTLYILAGLQFDPMYESEAPIDAFLPTGPDSRIEVYLRSLAPTAGNDRQMDCLSRLHRLAGTGEIGSVSAHVWGDSICTHTPEISGLDHLLSRVGDIYSFAADNDPSVTPFFRVTRVDAAIPGESFERIVPPRCAVLCYEADTLVGVFPCLIEGESYTPMDVIERLETRVDIEFPESVDVGSHSN
jgi:hypothetical protein